MGEVLLLPENDEVLEWTWDAPLVSVAVTKLLDRGNQIPKACSFVAGCRKSGLWLNALPSPALGTLFDSESFYISVAHGVGEEVCQPHTWKHMKIMDALGLHGLSCRYSAGQYSALNECVRRALQSAGVPSFLEPVGIDRGDSRRRDGIFPLSEGKCLCWDVTCVDTCTCDACEWLSCVTWQCCSRGRGWKAAQVCGIWSSL